MNEIVQFDILSYDRKHYSLRVVLRISHPILFWKPILRAASLLWWVQISHESRNVCFVFIVYVPCHFQIRFTAGEIARI